MDEWIDGVRSYKLVLTGLNGGQVGSVAKCMQIFLPSLVEFCVCDQTRELQLLLCKQASRVLHTTTPKRQVSGGLAQKVVSADR